MSLHHSPQILPGVLGIRQRGNQTGTGMAAACLRRTSRGRQAAAIPGSLSSKFNVQDSKAPDTFLPTADQPDRGERGGDDSNSNNECAKVPYASGLLATRYSPLATLA